MTAPTFVFAGGGTGGHLFPGIAVAAELERRHPSARIIFAGAGSEVERRILRATSYEHRILSVEPSTSIKRRPFRFVWRNWRAYRQARTWLRDVRPDAVIGLGSFASTAVGFAAGRLDIPIAILEQNVLPGRANRWLSRRACAIGTSFEAAASYFPIGARDRIRVVGNPVRSQIAQLAAATAQRNVDSRTLLVLGGSQGATAVNDAVLGAAAELRGLLRGWSLMHQTGPAHVAAVCAEYDRLGINAEVSSFFPDIAELFRRRPLVISRAGATTLAELSCAGCPAILIPDSRALDDHQTLNARWYEDHNAAVLVRQTDDPAVTACRLSERLCRLLREGDVRQQMSTAMHALARPQAAQTACDMIETTAGVQSQTPSLRRAA